MSSTTKIVGIVILALAIAIGLFVRNMEESSKPAPSQNNMLGGDRDEHGCIGSAGYSWCAAKNKCLRTWEEPCL